jgi:hypothetical protein
LITHQGKTQNLARWAAEIGISREAMRTRVKRCLDRGLDASAAITPRSNRGRKRQ